MMGVEAQETLQAALQALEVASSGAATTASGGTGGTASTAGGGTGGTTSAGGGSTTSPGNSTGSNGGTSSSGDFLKECKGYCDYTIDNASNCPKNLDKKMCKTICDSLNLKLNASCKADSIGFYKCSKTIEWACFTGGELPQPKDQTKCKTETEKYSKCFSN